MTLNAAPMDQDDSLSIAIIGMAGRFPEAKNIAEFWANLKGEIESIRQFTDEELLGAGIDAATLSNPNYVKSAAMLADVALFDAGFFGITPREAETMDPQQRIFLEVAWETLEHAGYAPGTHESVVGVYAGLSRSTYLFENLQPGGRIGDPIVAMQSAMGNEKDFMCGRAAFHLDLRGPAVVVQTACSTSLAAVHQACQSILNGECDIALAGGVSVTTLREQGYLYTEGSIFSPDGHCRAFDAGSAGIVSGNGIGLVALKSLASARADGDAIYAVIRGSAMNNDGSNKIGFTAPSSAGQAAVITEALAVAGVDAASISYVEAHGTGTKLGDPIELAALRQAFGGAAGRKRFCAVGSVKTNIGHLDAAAGIAGLIKTTLALQHRTIPASLHFSKPNPDIDFEHGPFYVNAATAAWRAPADLPRRAGVSSFGIGGTNVHVVLEEAPEREPSGPSRPAQLLLLSARTPSALDAASADLQRFLAGHPGADLADVAYTLQTGRRHFEHRRMLVCRDVADARQQLGAGGWQSRRADKTPARIVFLFPGQGSQHVDMARELYDTEPVFRAEVDACAQLLQAQLGLDIRSLLFPSAGQAAHAAAQLNQTQITQPALFTIEYALARLLNEWGITADAMLGHSLGEYVAACLAGVFSLADALALVAQRGRLIAALPAGAMLSVNASEQMLHGMLGADVWIAAVNAQSMCSVAGSVPAIEAFARRLAGQHIGHQAIPTSHAFHSGMMAPIVEQFAACVAAVKLQAPRTPYLSSVSGDWITPEQATDPAYWAAQLRQPVRFADCLERLQREPAVLLEVGPGRALSSLARQAVRAADTTVSATLPHAKSSASPCGALLQAVGQLWLHGRAIGWPRFYRHEQRHRLALPSYPFERQRYWVDAADRNPVGQPGSAQRKAMAQWFYAPSWQRTVRLAQKPGGRPRAPQLVFADHAGLDVHLLQALRDDGADLLIVSRGERFAAQAPDRYTIDAQQPAHYVQLFERLQQLGQAPATVTYLWNLAPAEGGFQTLLYLLQAIAGGGMTSPPALTVVTCGAHAVTGDETLAALQALTPGLVQVMALEHPAVRARHIDIGTPAGQTVPARLSRLLADEIAAPVVEAVIAYRGQHRWTPTYEPLALAPDATPKLRHGGHYLVTGGLGGIGYAFAHYLASRQRNVRLTLVGRSALPAGSAQDEYLASHGEHDPLSQRIRRLRQLQAMDCTVNYHAADIADQAHMERLAAATGAVCGIFHAAGLPGSGLIQGRTAAATAAVLAPKVDGTLVLDRVFDGAQLDFMVLCSSLAAVLPLIGQADYCAANAFLDAYAQAQHMAQRGNVISVNWAAWDDVGMAADAKALGLAGAQHLDHLDNNIRLADAVPLFDMLLSNSLPQVIVSPVDLKLVRDYVTELQTGAVAPQGRAAARGVPDGRRPALATPFVAARSASEQAVAAIWQEAFGIASIGVRDDFFELGGHSMLATHVMSQIRAVFKLELPLKSLFEALTIEALASRVDDALQGGLTDADAQQITPAARTEAIAPSFAQQRLWFLDQLEPGGSSYNIPAAVRLSGHCDVAALTRTLNEIVRRHEALRTTFASVDGAAVQIIASALELALPLTDLGPLHPAERDAKARMLMVAEAQTPFALADGPLIRAGLIRLDHNEHVLFITLHHIVSDGWSMGVLVREIAALYGAYAQGLSSPLPELAIQYADFAHWQRERLRGEVLERQLGYWTAQLAQAPTLLSLPGDRPRPAVQGHRGQTLPFTVAADVTAGLQALGQQVQGTLFMTLAAAFNVLLARYAGQNDICIGTPIANRNRAELEPLIGFFVNTLVLRARVDGDMPFAALLQQVRATTLDAYAHQDLPFEQLVDAVKPERHTSHSPLFQVLLVLDNAPMGALELPGLSLQPVFAENTTAKFDLTLRLMEQGDALFASLEYNTDLFDGATIERMARHFQRLLASIVADPACPVGMLAMLDDAEQRQLLVEWNDTAQTYPQGQAMHQWFEAQAAGAPERTALVCEGATLTYAELNGRANRLAHHLRAQGVGPDVLVGICAERSLEMVVGLLAILKAGGAYVPLDPAYPRQRLAYMLGDAAPALLLTQRHLLERLPAAAVPVFCLDRDAEQLDACPDDNPASVTLPEHLAYVIYTSGSTGQPKGAGVAHAGIANRLQWMQQAYGMTPADRVLQKTPFSFDVSVWEFFWPLAQGATLVMAKPGGHQDPQYLAGLIAGQGVTIVHFVPSMLEAFLGGPGADALAVCGASLRHVVCSGEALPYELQRRFFARFAHTQLHNLYGPTEASVDVTAWTCQRDSLLHTVPIGRPIANISTYIVDAQLQPAPVGVAGELYLAGVGLARGYLGRADLTAEKFLPHPFSAAPGARWYRTGDLARYLADGGIEYLGRIDQQVKLRGLRIELGEIEAALMAVPEVREAAVLAREDVAGDKRLVAYLVAHEGAAKAELEAELETTALRVALLRTLPDYMVPAHFMVLDSLPLSPNGKLDRKALPAPDLSARSQQYVAPRTPTEIALASIWAEVLKLEQVSAHDNFFDLGGHSLLATQLMSKLRGAFAVELPLRTLFEASSVELLAQCVDQARQEQSSLHAPAIVPVARGGQLPLSFAQQRLWFLDQFESGSSFYNIPAAVRLNGRLDVAAMRSTLNDIVRRHEALRTSFASIDGAPVQHIAPALELALPLTDLSELPVAEREAKALWLAQDEAQTPFDLATGPLLRAALIRLAAQEHIIVLTLHHIVSDGWSLGVLVQEIAALYGAHAQGLPSPLPELAIQYADFAHWQREWLSGDVLERQLGYWRRQLAQAPTLLSLPTDRARPAQQSYRGATLAFTVPAAVTAGLHALGRQTGSTLFMTLAAAFNVLLSRYAGQSDICIGTPIANRNRGELEPLIGFFVNTLVLRAQVDGDAPFTSLLRQLRTTTLDAYAHQDLPFEQLVDAVKPERHTSHAPLFQVLLMLDNTPMQALQLPELSLQPVAAGTTTAKYDLTLNVVEGDGGLFAAFEYNTDLFDGSTIERMAGHFNRLLAAIVADPSSPVGALTMLDGAEQRQLLVQWNATAQAWPQELAMHQLFEAQAARAPQHSALVFEGESLSYAELNARANRLAHHLRAQGVGPDVLVGIGVERSFEMVTAMLAVLKAGGAYVPLDPAYPQQRLGYMLRDADPALLLTQQRLLEHLPAGDVPVFCLDRDWDRLAAYGDDNPVCLALPDNLAYVIYTSGSTGQPKGVGVRHRSLANFLHTMGQQPGMSEQDVLLSVTSLSFDIAALELLLPLVVGASTVLVSRATSADPQQLSALLEQLEVSVMQATPSTWRMLNDHGWPKLVRPLKVLCGGEALPADLARQMLAHTPTIWNLYGPTETTIWSAVHGMHAGDSRPFIGRPIGNTEIYILDAGLNPVPVGVAGQLYIAGAGLARGYLRRPDLTAERFIADPFSRLPGARMYQSGDLARYRADGVIDYLGRIDDQVKIRGFRIELGEIESALAKVDGIAEAVVVARSVDGSGQGEQRLIAYLVLRQAGGEADAAVLRAVLSQSLPEYMLPSQFVVLERLPLTPNGKTDRKALPAPDMSRGGQDYVAPRTPTEQAVAAIWAEVLKLDRVGVHDNFFELGGHSLLATQLMSKLRGAFAVELPLRTLFEAGSVELLAQRVDQARQEQCGPAAPAIVPVARDGRLPLSFAQQRLWFLDQFESGSSFYNIPAAVRLNGRLDVAAMRGTLNEIVRRHEALRTSFASVDGTPVQVIAPALEVALPLTDLSELPAAEREAKALWLAQDAAQTPFDLAAGPLLRAALIRLAPREHIVVLTLHHIVSDGWSMGVLVAEIAALYGARVQGLPSPLPALAIQYADFAHWQREWLSGEVLERQLGYWRAQLAQAPTLLPLPTDRARPAVQTYHGATLAFTVPAAVTAGLQALGQQAQGTLFMTLAAAFNVLLSRYAGQSDICIGTPIANRNRGELEPLIGFFVNTLVLRAQVDGDMPFTALLAQLRATTLDAYAHQDLPFEQLVDAVKPERHTSHAPLFQVMLSLQNTPMDALELPELSLQPVPSTNVHATFDLTLNVIEEGGQLSAAFEYNTDLFDASTIEAMAGHFGRLLQAIVADPAAPVGALNMLDADERQRILVDWNATAHRWPQGGQSVHQMFEAQAARNPGAAALVVDGATLSYGELDARANRLAHHLRARGVGPDVRVGLCVERSFDMMTGLLAILKAGGAYLPLDPAYPQERLAYMLEDAAPALLLTQQALLERLPAGAVPVVCLDRDAGLLAGLPASALSALARPANLAYVMYTSGSTGKPKGGMIEHAQLANLVCAQAHKLREHQCRSVLQFASLSFDMSVEEIFPALAMGACLVVRPAGMLIPDGEFLALIEAHGIDAVNLPTGFWHEWVSLLNAGQSRLPRSLRLLAVGGERVSAERYRQWARHSQGQAGTWINAYGPTENTVNSTTQEMAFGQACAQADMPIGRPLPNTEAYILDAHCNPVPAGVAGELYVAGAGLTRGYLNRPGLTAEKFVPHPFSAAPGARMYQTGDLARYLADGRIEYLGRGDQQVKLRGFRIELGEIEAALMALPQLREAAVLARQHATGEQRLVGYLVAHEGVAGAALEAAALRLALLRTLPDYMVPAHFMVLDKLPLSPNGKLDRKALPAPDLTARSQQYVAPSTPTEATLAAIWAEVLKLDRIGVHDNFFDLGGHSLLATQMKSKICTAFGIDLQLRTLFEAADIASLAQRIDTDIENFEEIEV